MLDWISGNAGLPRTDFIAAVDHPPGDAESRPDFMLSGKDYDIVCEQKLDSGLGPRQLERYLDLPYARRTYIALISNVSQSAPKDALVFFPMLSHQRRMLPTANAAVPGFWSGGVSRNPRFSRRKRKASNGAG